MSGSKPVAGSLGQAYFLGRRILDAASADALRFHPNCYYRASEDDVADCRPAWPAIIAAVTDDAGAITGVHRTWLDPAGGKARSEERRVGKGWVSKCSSRGAPVH